MLFLVFCGLAKASDQDVLANFFGHTGISDKHAVYHGEMLQHFSDKPTLGEGLPKDVQAQFRKLAETNNNTVYAVFLTNGRQTQDWYAFLVRENDVWKISAVRNLALPGVFYMALQELEHKAARTEKEEWQYQNMLLTLKNDSELKAYLKINLAKFSNVVTLLSRGKKEQSEKAARRLFINFAKNDGGTFELNIGGILDNSVGYLYVPPGAKPPTMSPSKFIYIEEITDGWYVYKTT